jgi:enoyl-CoA hydratase/carnithine racemase
MSEPQSLIVYEKRDPHIAIIRLNRPEKKNSISRDLYWALDGAWHKAKDDDDVWSIILTGTADAFCVGGDLKENLAFAKGEMTGPRSGPRQYSNLRALQMHKPIIAAVNGFAVGGGFNLALACHIRYCVPAAKFGCSEVRWSHMAAWPSYVCQLPTGWAYWFALTGQMVDADTAFRLGLVQKICDPDKLIDDCVELCTTINRNGRLIAAHTTEYIEDKLLYEIQGYEKGFEVHREYYAHLRQSKDYDEGSAAF